MGREHRSTRSASGGSVHCDVLTSHEFDGLLASMNGVPMPTDEVFDFSAHLGEEEGTDKHIREEEDTDETEEATEEAVLFEQNQRKVDRMRRNRASAAASRKRKRDYVEELERRCKRAELETLMLRAELQQEESSDPMMFLLGP